MREVRDIPIEKIVVGPSQSRVRQIEEDIDELAASIRKLGLLEPVVVYLLAGDKFELLTGQRRLLAAKSLGWEEIPAMIMERPPNEAFAKAVSLTENLVRRPLSTKDLIDACTTLYHHCRRSPTEDSTRRGSKTPAGGAPYSPPKNLRSRKAGPDQRRRNQVPRTQTF